MAKKREWLEVNRKGLEKLVEGRSRAFIITELIQNAWDESPSYVDVTIERISGTRDVILRVSDDSPDGFSDLSHAYQLFAESKKKGNPELRGRFNLGEKLILALCRSASIVSTTGSVYFDDKGRRTGKERSDTGTVVSMVLPMLKSDYHECLALQFEPPAGIDTRICGRLMQARKVLAHDTITLPTVVAGTDGVLRERLRKTRIDVLPASRGSAMLFEMGIPVMPLRQDYDVNVHQRIPMNWERDNVPDAWLRRLRTAVVNLMAEHIDQDNANAPWVRDALSDKSISDEAVGRIIRSRFGEKSVAYDLSDQEANARAVAAGYQVVHGSQLSRAEWEQTRRANVLPAAGRVTPSAKPKFSANGEPQDRLEPAEYTQGMERVVAFVERASQALIGCQARCCVVRSPQRFSAWYGGRLLTFNLNRLGWSFFAEGVNEAVMDLVIHELAHEFSGNHLSDDYYRALSKLGARMAGLALKSPEAFRAAPGVVA